MSRRRRQGRRSSKTLTLSAKDADWALVREKAASRGLSVSRYAEALVLGGWEARDGPPLRLDGPEQRELLGTVREFRSLLGERSQASSLIADLQTRVALLFDAWAVSMVDSGRRDALRALLATRLGAASADQVVGRIAALAEGPRTPDADPGPAR